MNTTLKVSLCVPAGLLLASGGEFAFVAFGEAVSKGVLPQALTSELYMVVALSMALVPYLAALGGKLGGLFERGGEQCLSSSKYSPMYAGQMYMCLCHVESALAVSGSTGVLRSAACAAALLLVEDTCVYTWVKCTIFQ
jgi:Kef-type K+ transport system membrane component KefB